MNIEDVEELNSFEQQMNDITRKILCNEDDDDDVWKKKSASQSKRGDELKVLVDYACLPHSPRSPTSKDGRISPEGSSSSTHSLNKGERPQEHQLLHCKPLSLKSFQKGSYLTSSSTSSPMNVITTSGSKPDPKTSLAHNLERLKDLSFHNRPSVLQLTSLWNNGADHGRMFAAHRSALDPKRDPTPGRGNIYVNPTHPVISRAFDDAHPAKDSKFAVSNGYHSDQSSTIRRHPDQDGLSKLQSCSSLVQAKSAADSRPQGAEPPSSLNAKPFRERGTSADRSFQLGSRRYTESAGSGVPHGCGKSAKPMQMSRWVFSRAGRDPLHKTNSLETQDGNPGFSTPAPLTRAMSLSKFDDDDEFRLSPPTTAAATATSHASKLTPGSRFGYGPKEATASGSYSFASTPVEGELSPTAAPLSLASLSNRNAYCFAHGGTASARTPSGGFGSAAKSPINGPVSTPYATLRLQAGRAKSSSLTRKEERCLSPHSLTSVPISPSTRLAEDIQATEIRRLRQDLQWAKDQVALLTSRLSTNAFDQSLSNIAHRLQQLSSHNQPKKNGELAELLATVESLRRQNFGQSVSEISGASFPAFGNETRSTSLCDEPTSVGGGTRSQICRQPSSDSVTSLTSSAASVFSSASQSATRSAVEQQQQQQPETKKKTVKNWLRSSFGKAFSRKKSASGTKSSDRPGSESSASTVPVPHASSMPSIPYPGSSSQLSYAGSTDTEVIHPNQYQPLPSPTHSSSTLCSQGYLGSPYARNPSTSGESYLSTSQNPYQLPWSGHKKDDPVFGGRLQMPFNANAVHKRSESLDQSTKLPKTNCLDLLLKDRPVREGNKITVCVEVSQRTDLKQHNSLIQDKEIVIGSLNVGDRTSWDLLDGLVRRVFQEHLIRLDPATSLGLNGESVYNYRVGEITRWKDSKSPELLPIGYLVGDIRNIIVTLRGNREGSVDLLAFETLIPKSILHRYLKLLLEHRRIILSGSTGTGKTYLAQRLAECLVTRSGTDKGSNAIAVFRVDSQSSKELRQYLTNMADQCERGSDRLPVIVILDNLHHVSSLSDVFSAFLDTNYQNSPYIIGTMNQATCSSTDLQLHHNFRWVLYANHIEPVRSFLGRYLRRLLVANEVTAGSVNAELNKVIEWLPKVWQHVNKFLETHSSCDITIGPRLFLLCPMDADQAQVWFTDLWNYSIVPYLLEAVREGIQTYGCRAPWEDLADLVMDSYPWIKATTKPALLRLRPEDVGYESKVTTPGDKTTKTDRSLDVAKDADLETSLVDIVNRLQEAAKQSDSDDTNNDAADLSQSESCKSEDSQCFMIADDISSSSCRTSVI